MATCQFCGKIINSFDTHYRVTIPNQKKDTTLCQECAYSFDDHTSNNANNIKQFIDWSNFILTNNIIDSLNRAQLLAYNKEAKERLANLSKNDSNTHNTPPPDYESLNQTQKGSNIWIDISQLIGFFGILVYVGVGMFIGYEFDHIIIGGIAGFIVGMASCSFLLMISSLCEDVSEIKTILKQKKD